MTRWFVRKRPETSIAVDSDASPSGRRPAPAPEPAPSASFLPHAGRGNLPAHLTSFVGREAEIREVADVLSLSRLTTLAGAGGIGKTRLGLEVAAHTQDRYSDGVAFVDLSGQSDPRLVPETVIAGLGLQVRTDSAAVDTLVSFFGQNDLLLMLDNCEQVVEACARLAEDLLLRCPRLHILATSREGLGVAGEVVWRLPPLSTPEGDPAGKPTSLLGYDSVALFTERARQAERGFELTEANQNLVAQICQRVDGIPLAIELAASRVRTLTVDQLLSRLQSRLSLLTTGARTAPDRQHTLRATIDWSYGLLADAEKRVFSRLSVFAGSFRLASAEAVVADAEVESAAIVDLLAHLVDKSLVLGLATRDGVGRYRLLETLREYASERLAENGKTAELRRLHARHFAGEAAQASIELMRPNQGARLDEIEADLDNYRSAMTWALEQRDETALRIPTDLMKFWSRASPKEGSYWIRRALPVVAAADQVRAEALEILGQLAWVIGENQTSGEALNESLALWQKLGDRLHQGRVLDMLGVQTFMAGDRAASRRHAEEALTLLRDGGDPWRLASLINNMAYLHTPDSAQSRELLEEALRLARVAGDPWMIGLVVDSFANLEFEAHRHGQARQHWKECLGIARELGDLWMASFGVEGIARLEVAEKRVEKAILLVAAADSIRAATGAARPDFWEALVTETLSDAGLALGADAAEAVLRRGAALSADDAIALALDETNSRS